MSTSDRELLELAAKSSQQEIQWTPDGKCYRIENGLRFSWNPLTDDGDALRLAVNVGIFDGTASFAKFYSWLADAMIVEDDEAKAFRRAITCYAAEIVRSMP